MWGATRSTGTQVAACSARPLTRCPVLRYRSHEMSSLSAIVQTAALVAALLPASAALAQRAPAPEGLNPFPDAIAPQHQVRDARLYMVPGAFFHVYSQHLGFPASLSAPPSVPPVVRHLCRVFSSGPSLVVDYISQGLPGAPAPYDPEDYTCTLRFFGPPLAPGWELVDLSTGRDCAGIDQSAEWAKRHDDPSSSIVDVRIRVWNGVCTLFIHEIKLRGPVGAHWQEAFLD